jgi:drug/metabolite transporter (DMT)-like permease
MGFNPLLTALLSALVFGVRLRRQQWLAMPIGVMGVGFVVLGGGPRTQVSVGDLWVLFGCFCWAIYNATAARLLPRDTSGMTNTASVMTMGALGLCAWALWQGQVANGLTHLHAESALSLLVITFGGTVLSYIFWNQGLASMGAPRAAMFMNLVPVSSLVFSVIEGKGVSGVQLVGGAAVMGAVMLASWNPNAA